MDGIFNNTQNKLRKWRYGRKKEEDQRKNLELFLLNPCHESTGQKLQGNLRSQAYLLFKMGNGVFIDEQ